MASEQNADGNPFEGLLITEEARKELRNIYEREHAFSSGLFQQVFLTTIVSDDMVPATNHVVRLSQLTIDMQSSRRFKSLSVENMEQALLERLQLEDPRQCLLRSSKKDAHPLYSLQQATEKSVIRYLAFCYARSMLEVGDAKKVALADWSRKLIINYAVICLSTPEMFSIANPLSDFMMAFHSAFTNNKTQVPTEFFSQVILQLDEALLQGLFAPVFQQLYQAMGDPNFSLSGNQTFTIVKTVEFLACEPRVAPILVNMPFWLPPHPVLGKSFESASFIGRMLSISCCPSNPLKQPMTFDNPVLLSKESVEIIVSGLQEKMRVYIDSIVKIVRGLFKAEQKTKLKMLEWIVECCNHNVDRTKMAEFVDPVTSIVTNFGNLASDGFFLNLTWVISRLTAPFCGCDSPQLSGVDVKYCLPAQSRSDEECGGRVIRFTGHVKMSRPPKCADMAMEEDVRLPFHFTTHCFYMAHHCLSVGLVPVLRRYERLATASRRVQMLVQRIQMSNDPSLLRALEGANVHLNLVYTLKAHLLHPQLVEAILTVYGGTADWLSQQVLKFSDPESIVTGKTFPVTDAILYKIQYLPEALISCLANFAMFIKKFYLNNCHISDKDCARQFVTFISIFLGNNKLIKNPHLRAELVELLSLVIPQDDSDDKKKAALFHSHKLASDLLIRVLLQLFVDIENSGDNEINLALKFGYRLPIYDVLKYLWPFPEYLESINVLCKESDTETEPPVFLKFLNLMVDDSTLLLDLAFENLAKVRTIELEKKAGGWNNLSAQEKQEKEEQLAEASHIAKITNLLARKTVHTLTFLTASTPGPFITESMVDKIASTLNYYLRQLVGPKQKELKVEDFERYSFRPDLLVSDIVTVYINLSFNQSFCEAIPRDGRSYSPELFSQAERILKVLKKPSVMIMQLNQFAMKVKEAASALENMETTMGDAPEEFLDPVLGTIMNDPVTLPNSNVTLDRTTIVRHLLSDATDPFTRAPLTMDQVIPNTELKLRIEAWKNNLCT